LTHRVFVFLVVVKFYAQNIIFTEVNKMINEKSVVFRQKQVLS